MQTSSAAPESIDEYIAQYPAEVQEKLRAIRDEVRALAPDALERISYGMPTFTLGKNIFHFAAFRNHIGLYPGTAAVMAFSNELQRYKTSKGAIQIPLSEAIPLPVIRTLVRFKVAALASSPKGKK